jgi:hypothetical protein
MTLTELSRGPVLRPLPWMRVNSVERAEGDGGGSWQRRLMRAPSQTGPRR